MDTLTFPIQRAFWFLCLLMVSGISNAKTHPSYLTPEYCESLVEQFVGSGMRSLDKYVNENFNPAYRGGIRNTIQFLEQRSAWLKECDDYLIDTAQGNVFYSSEISRKIFTAMDALAKELQHVRQGVEYPDDAGNNNPAPFIKRRYETLAQLVDRHHTRMLMKKQFR
ncbi:MULTISPECIES: hypothetical protein [unclassified Microbulbifer]|uniref:hypothetical protein n=1 Tax=unclassified Microbulbifer TaxID=2619833 RepID=UPI0027E55414|nr:MULTISPECIES: hypothetical protein [unclassified Microbulbifer]